MKGMWLIRLQTALHAKVTVWKTRGNIILHCSFMECDCKVVRDVSFKSQQMMFLVVLPYVACAQTEIG